MNTKKRITIAAVVVAVICVIGVAVFFAAPYVKNVTDSARKPQSALKDAGQDVADSFNSELDKLILATAGGKSVTFTGYTTVDKLSADSVDVMKYLAVDTVEYEYGLNLSDMTAGGRLDLKKAGGDTVAQMYFYTDGKTLYFKVPQLCSYNFKADIENALKTADVDSYMNLGFDLNDVKYSLSLLESVDNEEKESYSKAIKSVVKDLKSGYDKAIEEIAYEKGEAQEYSRGSDSKNVTAYSVTVEKQALLDGSDTAIEAIFDDQDINGYRTLITSYYKDSRQKLKDAVAEKLSDYEPVTFTAYVDGSSNLVAAKLSDGTADILIEMMEPGKVTYYSYSVVKDGASVQTVSERVSDDTYNVSMSAESADVAISYSGQSSRSYTDKLAVDASSFTNAVDVENISNAQSMAILREVIANSATLTKLISGDALTELLGGMLY